MSGVTLTLLINDSPAAADVMTALQELVVETALDVAGSFRLKLGTRQTTTGDWPFLDPALFPPGASVRIGVAVGATPAPSFFFVGYVASQSVVYGDGPGGSSVEIGGVDKTVLMNLQERTVAWPNLPDATIATQIFDSYHVICTPTPGGPVLADPEGTTIQRGTDIRFLKRLARRNGFEVFVAPQPDTGIEVGYFQPFPLSGTPVATFAVRAGTSTTLTGLRVAQDMLNPTTATIDALDYRHSQQSATITSEAALLGMTSALSRVSPAPIVRLTGTGLTNATDLTTAAQAAVDRASLALRAEGVVSGGAGPLHPCDLVTISGAGAAYSGPWAIRSVTHRLTPDGYTQRFSAVRNAVGNLDASQTAAAVAAAVSAGGM